MSQQCFLQFLYHTKLIGAFARGKYMTFLGKIRKTVHFGAIFTVQKFDPNVSSCLTYANADDITTWGKTKKTAVAIQLIWNIPPFSPICPPFCPYSGPENKNVNIFSYNTLLYITIIPLKHKKLIYVYIFSR